MQALRRKARALGVELLEAEVAAIEREGDRATARPARRRIAHRRRDGDRHRRNRRAGAARAARHRASRIGAETDGLRLRLPRASLPGFPLLIDPTGVYVRPEGDLYIAGGTPPPENDPPATDFEVDHAFFEETIWPVLAARVPAFEAIRPGRAWAGHYDMNLFDHNAIVGPLPGIAGILIATGFSGHGLQQAPAVGRGLAELIVHGRYMTLDLSPLGYDRVTAGRPLREANVV